MHDIVDFILLILQKFNYLRNILSASYYAKQNLIKTQNINTGYKISLQFRIVAVYINFHKVMIYILLIKIYQNF